MQSVASLRASVCPLMGAHMQESVRATWPSMQSVALTYVRQHTEILREIYMGPRVDTSGDVCVYMRENIYLNICPQRVAKNLNVCVCVYVILTENL